MLFVMPELTMKHDFPPLPWLRAFEAAARHLSFTHAASELNLTQAAVSKQVKQLELHLREQLFIRHPRSLELTKSGESYLPKIRDAFIRLSRGTQEVFGRRRSEILTIRAAVGFSVNWLAPRLPDFIRQYPDVQLRFISSVWNEIANERNYDFDIRYGTGTWSGMTSQRLTWEKITPVCSAELAASGSLKSPADLANHCLINVLGYQEGWSNWLQAAEIDDARPGDGHQVDTSLLAFQLAAQGDGIALARSSMAEPELAAMRLVKPFDLEVEIEEAFYLVSAIEGRAHPDSGIFAQWISGQAEKG